MDHECEGSPNMGLIVLAHEIPISVFSHLGSLEDDWTYGLMYAEGVWKSTIKLDKYGEIMLDNCPKDSKPVVW